MVPFSCICFAIVYVHKYDRHTFTLQTKPIWVLFFLFILVAIQIPNLSQTLTCIWGNVASCPTRTSTGPGSNANTHTHTQCSTAECTTLCPTCLTFTACVSVGPGELHTKKALYSRGLRTHTHKHRASSCWCKSAPQRFPLCHLFNFGRCLHFTWGERHWCSKRQQQKPTKTVQLFIYAVRSVGGRSDGFRCVGELVWFPCPIWFCHCWLLCLRQWCGKHTKHTNSYAFGALFKH